MSISPLCARPDAARQLRRAACALPAAVLFGSAAFLSAQNIAGTSADWATYGGTFGQQRFSLLRQIDTANAGRLRVAWTFAVPDRLDSWGAALEVTPLVVRGRDAGRPDVDAIMFITSPMARVIALDAGTGRRLWEFAPPLRMPLTMCCSIANRGVAYGRVERPDGRFESRVFVATPDARIWVLSAATGAIVDGFTDGVGPAGSVTVGDNARGFSLTMAPLFISRHDIPGRREDDAADIIVVGTSGGEFETRGFVAAYDARTGRQLWRFFTIPAPGEFGGDTWPSTTGVFADPYLRGGGGVWMTPAYDDRTGRIFFTAGNPSPNLDGTHRAGDNLFTNSILALDIRTGERVWHYQQVHHDLWDYDPASPPVLMEVGRRPAVAQAGKTGFFYILDRETGVPIFPCPETIVPASSVVAPDGSPEVTSPTQPTCDKGLQFVPMTRPGDPVPVTGPAANLHPIFTPPDGTLRPVAPGLFGGSEWSPVAYDPRVGLAFISAVTVPVRFIPFPQTVPHPGSYSLGGLPIPVFEKVGGTLTAIDAQVGKIRWQKQTSWPLVGGALATAGGLLFYGEGYLRGGSFVGLEAATGAEVFRYWTKGGVNAAPMTYEANKKQFVAVAAGGLGHSLTAADNLIIAFALEDER
jgi:PQQ-dependent dehydrogenase (methanol/ethanol family)